MISALKKSVSNLYTNSYWITIVFMEINLLGYNFLETNLILQF